MTVPQRMLAFVVASVGLSVVFRFPGASPFETGVLAMLAMITAATVIGSVFRE